jgi:hypothetical protein
MGYSDLAVETAMLRDGVVSDFRVEDRRGD